MTEAKKNNMKSWVSIWLTPSLILGSLIYGAWFVSGYKAESNQRMFETVEQRVKTKDHIDSDYNEVKNYQLMLEQKQMKIDLDSEKRSMQKIWKQREKQIDKVLLNTTGMYGSIKGIAGNAIQPVALLELPLEDESDQ